MTQVMLTVSRFNSVVVNFSLYFSHVTVISVVEIQNTKLFDNVAGVTNGSNTKADTEQHTRKLSQFFEDQ